jgi:hypothetical protein
LNGQHHVTVTVPLPPHGQTRVAKAAKPYDAEITAWRPAPNFPRACDVKYNHDTVLLEGGTQKLDSYASLYRVRVLFINKRVMASRGAHTEFALVSV